MATVWLMHPPNVRNLQSVIHIPDLVNIHDIAPSRPGNSNDVCVLGAFVSHHSWGGWVAGARRHGGGFGDGGGSGVGGRGRGGHMRVPLAYLYACLNMLRFAQVGHRTGNTKMGVPRARAMTKFDHLY